MYIYVCTHVRMFDMTNISLNTYRFSVHLITVNFLGLLLMLLLMHYFVTVLQPKMEKQGIKAMYSIEYSPQDRDRYSNEYSIQERDMYYIGPPNRQVHNWGFTPGQGQVQLMAQDRERYRKILMPNVQWTCIQRCLVHRFSFICAGQKK